MAWLCLAEMEELGFSEVGENVLISDKASLYNCANISIGDNVRVDDYCILSAGDRGIQLGDYIHIAAFSLLIGVGKILIEDFAGLSSRVSIYSSSDDYSGAAMTNPMVPEQFTGVVHDDVSVGRHTIIGSGSVVLPGVVLGDGVAIGALSLVAKNCEAFGVYSGNPLRRVKDRKRNLVQLEEDFLSSKGST